MGFREYMERQKAGSRVKVSALVSFSFHALIFLAGSLSLATQAEFGMAGSTASQPAAKPAPPVEMETTLLSEDDAEPVKKTIPKPKPIPTPEAPQDPAPPASAPATASGQTFQIPAYYRNPPPPYPAESQKLKQEGTVLLRVDLDSEGKVVSVSVDQTSGFPLLDGAALKTVQTWRFKPARLAGVAISTQLNVPVKFRLEDAK